MHEVMQQWMTPDQLTNELTMTWKLNPGNLVESLQDQMCRQPP
jgi:hypothetical protein